MFECDGVLVEQRGVDFEKVGKELAAALPNGETWGTRSWGRVVADMTPESLLAAALDFLQGSL